MGQEKEMKEKQRTDFVLFLFYFVSKNKLIQFKYKKKFLTQFIQYTTFLFNKTIVSCGIACAARPIAAISLKI